MFSEFQDQLVTTDDRNALLEEIGVVSQAGFFTDPAKRDSVFQQLRSDTRELWRNFLSDNQSETIDWQAWHDELQQLPVIQIRCAVELRPEFMTELVQFVRQQSQSKQALLNIQIDPKLLGGAVMIIDGKLLDFSLQKQVKEYMQTQSDQILSFIYQ